LKRRRWWIACVLVLWTFTATSCSKPKNEYGEKDIYDILDDAVDSSVSDPQRAQQIKQQYVLLHRKLNEFYDNVWRMRTAAFYMALNYDAGDADFERQTTELKSLRSRSTEEMIEIAMSIRQLMSESEWQTFSAQVQQEYGLFGPPPPKS